MKLSELGPRIKLEIYKVEEGVNEGEIMYHKFVQKSEEEAKQLKERVLIFEVIRYHYLLLM